MKLLRVGLIGAVVAVPALAIACNDILGIDAPTLRGAGADGGLTSDGTVPKGKDSGADARGEASRTETGADGSRDAGDGSAHDAREDHATLPEAGCHCADGATCPAVALVSGQLKPSALFVDPEAGVFWTNVDNTNLGNGTVWHTNLDGTGTTEIAIDQSYPAGIAYERGFVYWSQGIAGTLQRCALSKCTVQTLAAMVYGARAVAVAPSTLFTTTPVQLASVDLTNAATFDADAPVTDFYQGTANEVAVDSQNVYWTTASRPDAGAGVFACPLTGCGGAPRLVAATTTPGGIASNGTQVFWTDVMDNAVYAAPTSGSGDAGLIATVTPPSGDGLTGAIAVDATHLYLSMSDSQTATGQIVRMNLDGSGVVTIASGGQPEEVGLAGSCLYWLDGTGDAGHVYASAK